MLLARNMLSAFFYSPLVRSYVSYLCELDINSLCLATEMHDIYEERIHFPAYVHVYYIYIYISLYNIHIHKQEYEFFLHKCHASRLPNKKELISN